MRNIINMVKTLYCPITIENNKKYITRRIEGCIGTFAKEFNLAYTRDMRDRLCIAYRRDENYNTSAGRELLETYLDFITSIDMVKYIDGEESNFYENRVLQAIYKYLRKNGV